MHARYLNARNFASGINLRPRARESRAKRISAAGDAVVGCDENGRVIDIDPRVSREEESAALHRQIVTLRSRNSTVMKSARDNVRRNVCYLQLYSCGGIIAATCGRGKDFHENSIVTLVIVTLYACYSTISLSCWNNPRIAWTQISSRLYHLLVLTRENEVVILPRYHSRIGKMLFQTIIHNSHSST